MKLVLRFVIKILKSKSGIFGLLDHFQIFFFEWDDRNMA